MPRRPNKPHRDGFVDEEDCVGHYDPDMAEARGCHHLGSECSEFDRRVSETSTLTGRECYQMWVKEEKRRQQEREDAMTPDEKAKRAEFLEGLRNLY